MIDDNTRFTIVFRMSPPNRWQDFEAVTFAALPGIYGEMAEWQAKTSEIWGPQLDTGQTACHMAITAVYGPAGAIQVEEEPNEEADEILAEAVRIGESLGYRFDYDGPIVHINSALHAVQAYLI